MAKCILTIDMFDNELTLIIPKNMIIFAPVVVIDSYLHDGHSHLLVRRFGTLAYQSGVDLWRLASKLST